MGRITDITKQKRGNRVNIYIDGEFVCGLEAITAAKYYLAVGKEIDEDKLHEMTVDSEIAYAFDCAANYACRRMRTEKEVSQYLVGKQFAEEVVQSALSKLKDYRYINDEEYARVYVREYSHKFGKRRMSMELSSRGVSDEWIDQALDEYDGEQNACLGVARKYLDSHSKADRNKLASFLMGRGYEWDNVRDALELLKSEDN